MIKIYVENVQKVFLEAANKKLNDLLDDYFFPFDDIGEEYIVENIFPQHLYRANKEKCINTISELREYVRDLSIHELTPLHEYALLNILSISLDYEEDTKKSIEIKNEHEIEFDKNGGFTINDLDNIDFFIENCFQDHDFNGVEKIFEHFFLDPLVEKKYNINLEEYEDLVAKDIFQKYLKVKEMYIMFRNLLGDKVSLEKQDGTVINNIQSSVQENKVYIIDDTLKIEEGDKIF